jgi:iron(III) transport system ATP-binding protein
MLTVESLTKIYNPADPASGGIRAAAFELSPGLFFSLLGPSGCGKTTTLRCIAGLEVPDQGRVTVSDRVLFDRANGVNIPMHRRGIGMVFQSYAIWPHMTVHDNVAFPLQSRKREKLSRTQIRDRVETVLKSVGLAGYGGRSATRLSGGEQQRVALARAIVDEPELLLLDEPLSNLDATLRDEMRGELLRLQRKTGITTVYVTHDQTEAMALSDLVAVVNKGRILQIGPPADIYFRPQTEFVAKFIGETNLIYGRALPGAGSNGEQAVEVGLDAAVRGMRIGNATSGPEVAVSFRPETIEITKAAATGATAARHGYNSAAGIVGEAEFLGPQARYTVEIGPHAITVSTGPRTVFAAGDRVALNFPVDSTVIVARDPAVEEAA